MLNRYTLAFLIAVSLFTACKARKKNKSTPPVVKTIEDTTAVVTAESLLSGTIKNWTYFSAKIDVEFRYDGDKKVNPNASIRMYKDSLIWISGGMFGIEAFRMLINRDSMVILNKLEKTYTIYKNTALHGISDIPLTVSQIQNLILGNPVYALKLYEIIRRNDQNVSIGCNQENFKTTHNFRKDFLTIDTTAIKDNKTPNFAEARYSEYTVVNTHNFPMYTFITATNGKKIYMLELKYSDPDFEEILTFPFTIPASYEKTK